MKNIKALLLSFALVCLLAPAALSNNGTMTSGGDRTSSPPPPPPAIQSATDTGTGLEPAPDAGGEEGLAEMMIQEALVWIASWTTLL